MIYVVRDVDNASRVVMVVEGCVWREIIGQSTLSSQKNLSTSKGSMALVSAWVVVDICPGVIQR